MSYQNWALALNGGSASASSTSQSATFSAAFLINGQRNGPQWGVSDGWNDNNAGVNETVTITLAQAINVDRVIVVTLPNNFSSNANPTSSDSATSFGIEAWTIQAWNGTQWVTLATRTNNAVAVHQHDFTATQTTQVRFRADAVRAGFARLLEIEVWGAPPAGPSPPPPPPPPPSNVYPASLPVMQESEASREGGFVPSRATNGALKVRRLYSADKMTFRLVHWISDAQRATLESAYAANRTNNVTFTWPADGQTYTCRFAAAPQYTRRATFWVAQVVLEEV